MGWLLGHVLVCILLHELKKTKYLISTENRKNRKKFFCRLWSSSSSLPNSVCWQLYVQSLSVQSHTMKSRVNRLVTCFSWPFAARCLLRVRNVASNLMMVSVTWSSSNGDVLAVYQTVDNGCVRLRISWLLHQVQLTKLPRYTKALTTSTFLSFTMTHWWGLWQRREASSSIMLSKIIITSRILPELPHC